MTDLPILRDLGYILLAAASVLLVARAVRVPPIVAYMVAGLALGPVTGLIEATESVDLIAEVGIALLLFLVGLELRLDKIREVGGVALVGGLAQLALTAAGGYGLAVLLGFGPTEAVVLALALTFSSTVVVVKLLERRRDLSSLYGRIAIGILLVQDVAVAVVLTLFAGLGGAGTLDIETLSRGLLGAGAGMLALIAGAFVATRYVLPALFDWLAGSIEALFIWALTWCFLFIIAAEALGVSVEIGAFIAGVALAQLSHADELVRRVHPLVNFFLAVFFVALGVELQPGAALAHWPAVLALSLFVLVGKPLILALLLPRFGYGERTTFMGALTLGQVSEFSFIVASLALGAGMIGEDVLSVVGVVGLVTIGASAALVQSGDALYGLVRGTGLLRRLGAAPQAELEKAPERRGHIIVVGMNALGRRLVRAFVELGEDVLAIDTDPAKLDELPCATLQGNTEHYSVLERAGLERARLLVSALQIEDANNLLAFRCRSLGVPSSIHAFDPTLVGELREHGATYLISSKHDGTKRLAIELYRAGVI